jgi:hypothetical protein
MPIFSEKRAKCEWCKAARQATKETGFESRPFSKCSHWDAFLCYNKKRNCFLEFHNENYFATTGVSYFYRFIALRSMAQEKTRILGF